MQQYHYRTGDTFIGVYWLSREPFTTNTFFEIDNNEIIIRTRRFFFSYVPTPRLMRLFKWLHRALTASRKESINNDSTHTTQRN